MVSPAVLLYDDECGMCRGGSARLIRLARPGAVRREPSQSNAGRALMAAAGISTDQAQAAMRLVVPVTGRENEDGAGAYRVYAGAEAVVAALATRRGLGWLLPAVRLPVVRPALAWLYAGVAANRQRLSRAFGQGGASQQKDACEDDRCVPRA